MSRRSGSADLPLHGGRVPAWLGQRMTRLGAVIAQAIVLERGRIVHASPSEVLAGDEELLDRVIGMRKLHETAKELAADEAAIP